MRSLAGLRLAVLILAACLAGQAHATVTSTTEPTVSYSPSVNTTVFTVTFHFDLASDLTVTKITDATQAEAVLVQGVDYTVRTPVGTTQGRVTTTVAVTSDYSIRIDRDTDPTQPRSFIRQGSYDATVTERAHDRTVMALQDAVFQAGESADDAVAAHEGEADPHTQYVLKNGRSGGQTVYGGTATGENLVLHSNPDTDGLVSLASVLHVSAAGYVGINEASPSVELHVGGDGQLSGDLNLLGGANALRFSGSTASVIMDDNDPSALDIGTTGATSLLRFDTTNNLEGLLVDGYMYIGLDTTNRLYIDTDSDEGFVQLVGSGNDALTLSASSLDSAITIYEGSHATYPDGINILADHLRVTGESLTDGDSASVTIFGQLHGAMHDFNVLAGAVGTVDSVDDCHDVILASTDNTVVSLPEVTPATEPPSTFDGCEVTVINTGADGAALVSVSPHADDAIVGSCVGVTGAGSATVVQFSGAVNKDARNTKATANNGDYIKLVSYSTPGGAGLWYVTSCVGEWASEP